MKTHDSLGRRNRYAPPPDDPTPIRLNDADLEWLAFLHRHGGRLPTSYFFEYTKATRTHRQTVQVRLKRLWHNRFIVRPFQQEETLDPEKNETIHEIGPKGIELLKQHGLLSPFAPSMNGAFKHQVFLSCVSASIELQARELGIEYTPQHAVLSPLGHDHRITLPSGMLAPDEVFMLKIDGKDLLIFLEIDRATEGVDSYKTDRKSWRRNCNQYRELISSGAYRSLFDVDCGALLMVVTVNKTNMDAMLVLTEEIFQGKCPYMLFTFIPEFGRIFHPPAVLSPLTTVWERAGHNPFRLAVPTEPLTPTS